MPQKIDPSILRPSSSARQFVREPDDGRQHYVPYSAAEEMVPRLHFRRGNGIVHSISYSYLPHYTFDAIGGRFLILVDGILFTVVGRNLMEIIQRIDLQQCEWIQEFNEAIFTDPTYVYAPFIERIDVNVMNPAYTSGSSRADA